jgi:hypothetical protein
MIWSNDEMTEHSIQAETITAYNTVIRKTEWKRNYSEDLAHMGE